MRKLINLIVAAVMLSSVSYAGEADLSAVIARLERLEKENAELKKKVTFLEEEKSVKSSRKGTADRSIQSGKENRSNREHDQSKSLSLESKRNWDGFFAQISTGYEHNKITNTGLMDNNYVPPSSANYFMGTAANASYMPLRIDIGYYGSLSRNYLLGIGLEYSPIGHKSSFPIYSNPFVTGQIRFETSGRRSAFLSPAYAIDDDSLIYAKIGISQQDWKVVGTRVGNFQLGGIMGLGYKRFVYKGLYGFAEVNYYSYAESSKDLINFQTLDVVNFRPGGNSYNFVFGVGYKY